MAQTVDIIDDPAVDNWPHPFPELQLTLDPGVGVIGGGGYDRGGGGECRVNTTTQSIVSGNIPLVVGNGSDGSLTANGAASYLYLPDNTLSAGGGSGTASGGAGGSGGNNGDVIHSGGGSGTASGGGAGGANANGSNGVTITGGNGGSGALAGLSAAVQAALTGGKGGNTGVAGTAPGGGGGLNSNGANGRVVIPYTLVDASISGDTGSGTTASVSVDSGSYNPSWNIATAGNPVPALTISGGANQGAFELNADDPANCILQLDGNPFDGIYVVEITAHGSTDFVQTVTVTVGTPPPEENLTPLQPCLRSVLQSVLRPVTDPTAIPLFKQKRLL